MRRFTSRLIGVTTIAAVVAASCSSKNPPSTPAAPPAPMGSASPISDLVMYQTKDLPLGLDLKLSEGHQGAPASDRDKIPPGKKLADAEVQALLARMKPIATDAADQQAFALRARSQPPPRTGQTIKSAFPAPPSTLLPPTASDAGQPLKVLRWMPEGDVPYAPQLSVTFSQPMIAVTSQDDASKTTPVKLTPTPKGHWRWIGTRTILFDPDVRFPQATTYDVEIPAGTKSATGNALKDTVRFKFETPPPVMTQMYPTGGPYHLDEPMFVAFDQKIDPLAVIAHLHVTAGGAPVKLRLLDRSEIDGDKKLKPFADGQKDHDSRWLAFRATTEFPTDAQITVAIPAGTPSAEGPNKTKTTQSYSFRTYPPFKLVRSDCGWGSTCRPGMPFSIQLNNPIDVDKFDDKQVTVTPDIPGMKIVQSYSSIVVQGLTKPHTTYHVTVSRELRDEFGQTLGKDVAPSFSVGDAVPSFYGPSGMVVADPAADKPALDVFTTNYPNLKVQLWRVDVSDFDAFRSYVDNQWNHDHPPKMPGAKVFDQLVKTKPGKDQLVETAIDVSPALSHGNLGHAIAVIEPYPWTADRDPPRLITWVQSTKLAIDAHVDAENLVAFASELGSGKAASGIALEIKSPGITAKTDDSGIATMPLPKSGIQAPYYLVARRGDDVAFLTESNGSWNSYGSWVRQDRPTSLAWYVIDDRKMYRPGEEVALKGWLRTIDSAKNGDINGITGLVVAVDFKVHDASGNQIFAGSAPVNALGGFDTRFTLPKTPNLGAANVTLETRGQMHMAYTHQFQIEEFRRPEFEVSAHAGQGPFVVGDAGDVTVSAKYYSGGPLPGADVRWYLTASQSNFTPPNRDDFVFGAWRPWWGYEDVGKGRASHKKKAPAQNWSFASKTDGMGDHALHVDFASVNPAMPMSVIASASVTDVNRQQWTASTAMVVHPSSLYVGLKTKKSFVEKGTPFPIDVIGVDLDGKPALDTKIEVKAVRLDWEYKKGSYEIKEVDPQTCSVVAAKDPARCDIATPSGGTYQVTATIVDKRGRPNQTTLTFWVAGGAMIPARDVAQQKVELIPDKKDYAPGETAELLVQSPFYPAEGIVSWRRSGIVKTERIALTGPTATIKVPIADRMTPNMYVQVDLVGMAERNDDQGDPDPKLPKRPAYAAGSIDLAVPPKQRTLKVVVTPSAPKLAPGERASLALEVRDAQGKPVANAETVVVVVDEAVLALAGYQFPNPIDTFYGQRGPDARDYYSRGMVKLARPSGVPSAADANEVLRNGNMRQGSGGGGGRMRTQSVMPRAKPEVADKSKEEKFYDFADISVEGELSKVTKHVAASTTPAQQQQQQAVAIRSNFNPLAAFSPAVRTGGDGRATVEIKMPDNLTRYRVVAISVAGDRQFGKGENSLVARLPLMVRPSPPRFLNFGDTFKLPVVLQNQTDAAMTVKVAVRASNAVFTDGSGREVTVPANDRVEVQFPAAAQMAGTARFQIVGAAGSVSDAAELALPVWTPATTEAFATYGVIDDGAVKQPVALPEKVITQFGGIEVTTSSTNLQALTDALLYLVHYPFECAEQRASRVMAIAALKDVLSAFQTKDMPSQAAMEASVRTDIEHLSQMQNYDGGFAYWDRGRPSEPYLTVFVANALQRAKDKGFAIPVDILDRARSYLRGIESHYPAYYGKDIRWSISAYALYTRKLMGDTDVAKGQKLIREAGGVDKLAMEADGWLLGLFAGDKAADAERKAIVRLALNKVSETAGAANFTTHYNDGAYLLLASDRRVDGVMLESLIQESSNLDLIPKLVTGLLAHRKAGRWLNTQENSFVLVALDRYFQAYEKATPDFVARAWLGNDYAGDHAFKGRSTDYYDIAIAMKDVATHDKSDLTIQKDGTGRLYYRVGMTYAPASLRLEPADYGFVVERKYEAVDDPKDVTRTPDGTWHVKAGARVRVNLTMVNENRRYHVALVDPMPAGFEAMNSALAVTGPIPLDPKEQKSRGSYWWWYGPWYEHQNLRDERVEAFAALLWEGVHTYQYVARATTPGNFVVPPPKAEEMYMPETFGRGGSDRVIVE